MNWHQACELPYYHDPAGSGSPQLEGGFLRRWICAEVAAVVIGQLTGLMPVHE